MSSEVMHFDLNGSGSGSAFSIRPADATAGPNAVSPTRWHASQCSQLPCADTGTCSAAAKRMALDRRSRQKNLPLMQRFGRETRSVKQAMPGPNDANARWKANILAPPRPIFEAHFRFLPIFNQNLLIFSSKKEKQKVI